MTDHDHDHDAEGFDIVLPDSFRSDALLWTLAGISVAYLVYLIWSEFRQSRKTAVVIASLPTTTGTNIKPDDESKGL